MGNADQLGGRRNRRAGASKTELGADPLCAEYDRGPFPASYVPAFPAHLVRLVERATGRPFEPDHYAAYERIRAFTGYQGVEVVPGLVARQALSDPRGLNAPAVAPTQVRPTRAHQLPDSGTPAAMVRRGGGVDPRDLGD